MANDRTFHSLNVGDQSYRYCSLPEADVGGDISLLPRSLKVLMENVLRNGKGDPAPASAFVDWLKQGRVEQEIPFYPARVLMQDFTGVPAVCDLAAMRDAMKAMGGDPQKINPAAPVDLVIDHSVMVDHFGNEEAFERNVSLEFSRNMERYSFLRWGQNSFKNFRAVPPGTGICHQVNLEHLAKVVWSNGDLVYPDTLVGTDSHTTMINGLSVLGWGVGGIEAEAAMLGQPVTMLIPEVIGLKLTGSLPEGATATDLVLVVVERLRQKGVVGKFVEFFGDGLHALSLADRATLANMAPEYGATCGFFPIDEETCEYLRLTGREEAQVSLVAEYAKVQGLWSDSDTPDPRFTDVVEVDLGAVDACISGPKRPQDRIGLKDASQSFAKSLGEVFKVNDKEAREKVDEIGELAHGSVVIAAITSCTNTSNPSVMIGAGLLARNARKMGIYRKPWVKTSFAPGSQVVSDYLNKAGLQEDLDAQGFNLVGYGCTTCIGNSGPLDKKIVGAIDAKDLVVTAVLSGNRNFEGRISPHVKANYLASPPLVVAYALAGSMNVDLKTEPLGVGEGGKSVFLKDIWPSNEEIAAVLKSSMSSDLFTKRYSNVFEGPKLWKDLQLQEGQTYAWDDKSTYIRRPPFFDGIAPKPEPVHSIENSRLLAVLGDSVTTDHISPAGVIKADSPAGQYLQEHGVKVADFNSFGARRGNHEVMLRGTFGNIRLRNKMVPGVEGGFTVHHPSEQQMSIFDAAMKYRDEGVPLVVVAGKEYGTGSSRDWAAKGTRLLGVRAVIAESFERIHRSNLIGMGVLPLQFMHGESIDSLSINGTERISIKIEDGMKPSAIIFGVISSGSGEKKIELRSRIDTADELSYFSNGGILNFVLRNLS